MSADVAAPPVARNIEQTAKEYLEDQVVHVLMEALNACCRVRPENPVDFIASYLLRNNPHKDPAHRPVVEVSTNPDDLKPVPTAEEE